MLQSIIKVPLGGACNKLKKYIYTAFNHNICVKMLIFTTLSMF